MDYMERKGDTETIERSFQTAVITVKTIQANMKEKGAEGTTQGRSGKLTG